MHENAFRVGYARVCITPQESVPLQGYGNVLTRMSNNVLSDLYTTCICFTDAQDNTILMYQNDLISSGEEISVPIRHAVSEATGVPFRNIMITATHTHSGPAVTHRGIDSITRYCEFLKQQMVLCAQQAMQDRKNAQMLIATGSTKNLNFIRHYVLEDGNYRGDNFGDLHTSSYAWHTTQADETMRLVKFVRQGGKDVLLVNWQCHPHRTGGSRKYNISSDIIGVMRDELEAELDCCFIYFNGGAGNLNPQSRIPEENIYKDYIESGKALAKHAQEAANSFVPAQTGPVQMEENLHKEPINKPDARRLEKARELYEIWQATNDYKAMVAQCNEYGFNSPYAASAAVRKYEMPDDPIDVPMYAFSIGDVAFVTAPYEMFDTNAKYIRDFSPFKLTVVASCANDADSYIPSAYGFAHGCYEADCSMFRPGTGERLAQMYVKMLEKLYETKK